LAIIIQSANEFIILNWKFKSCLVPESNNCES